MTEKTMPPLGTGSVDCDALHAASEKKSATQADVEKAAQAATARVEPPAPAAAEKAPSPEPEASPAEPGA